MIDNLVQHANPEVTTIVLFDRREYKIAETGIIYMIDHRFKETDPNRYEAIIRVPPGTMAGQNYKRLTEPKQLKELLSNKESFLIIWYNLFYPSLEKEEKFIPTLQEVLKVGHNLEAMGSGSHERVIQVLVDSGLDDEYAKKIGKATYSYVKKNIDRIAVYMKYLFITKIRGIRDLLSEDGLAAEIKENMPLYLEKGSHPEMIYAGNDEKKWYIIRSPNDYLSRQAAQASQASSDVSDAAKSDVAKEIEEMIKFGRRITGETETPQKAKPESVEEAVKRIKVEDFNVQLNKISKGR